MSEKNSCDYLSHRPQRPVPHRKTHRYVPQLEIEIRDAFSGRVRQQGKQQVHTAAMANVEPFLVEFHEMYPNQDLPNPANEERKCNRNRATKRVHVIKNLKFDLTEFLLKCPSNFYR